jgi:transcriptional regulator with XRE-family HTH domain
MLTIDRDKLYREIGRRIRAIREECNPKLTQSELADKLGVERTSITNIEQGTQRATLHLLYSLAQRLQIPLEKLLPALDDKRIFQTGEITNLTEVRLGRKSKSVPNEVKLFVEKI